MVVPYEESPSHSYTFHTASGFKSSLQSVWPVNGEVQASDGSFSSDWCTSVSGVVGFGESFWLTCDSDGASLPQGMVDATGRILLDGRALPGWNFRGVWNGATSYNAGDAVTYRSTWYVAIGGTWNAQPDLFPESWAAVPTFAPGGVFPAPAPPSLPSEWNFVGFESWNPWTWYNPNDALTCQSVLYVAIAESYGNVFPPFNPEFWRPVPEYSPVSVAPAPVPTLPSGWNFLGYEVWNAETVYQEGDTLSDHSTLYVARTANSNVAPEADPAVWMVVPAFVGSLSAPGIVDWSALPPPPDSPPAAQDFPIGATEALGLRISVSRWDHQLFILYPATGESTPVTRGNLQGFWGPEPEGNVVFSSAGWFDAHAQLHPDALWVLWDATRQEYVSPDEGASASFLNAVDNTDSGNHGSPDWQQFNLGNQDRDGDGLTDATEAQIGSNPNQWSSAGDGYSDGWKVANGIDPWTFIEPLTAEDSTVYVNAGSTAEIPLSASCGAPPVTFEMASGANLSFGSLDPSGIQNTTYDPTAKTTTAGITATISTDAENGAVGFVQCAARDAAGKTCYLTITIIVRDPTTKDARFVIEGLQAVSIAPLGTTIDPGEGTPTNVISLPVEGDGSGMTIDTIGAAQGSVYQDGNGVWRYLRPPHGSPDPENPGPDDDGYVSESSLPPEPSPTLPTHLRSPAGRTMGP